jgi:hypothetical protein
MALIRMGDAPASPEATLEMAAAFGEPIAELLDEAGLQRAALMSTGMAATYSLPALRQAAAQAPLEDILAVVPHARRFVTQALLTNAPPVHLTEDVTAILIAQVGLGLGLVMVRDIPGLADLMSD